MVVPIDVHVLEQLLRFWVVVSFDLVIIQEVLLLAFVVVKLKAVAVECIVLFVSAEVVDRGGERSGWFVVGFWSVCEVWGWGRPIFVFLEVIQNCLDMMGSLGRLDN